MSANPGGPILLTGATGYVGGRLLRALEAGGRPVRCLTRQPERLHSRVAPTTSLARGDVRDPAALRPALEGVDTAYYLVHSMASVDAYEEQDRRAATGFARAAREAGVRRIVYLGGLGESIRLSSHLASRQEVGRLLRESGVATLELRASIILGSGSLSFEMIRALVDKLPVMVTPRWVDTPTQPIGIEDVVAFLVQAADLEWEGSGVFEIGGPDRVSYLDLMREYARQRGLRRIMIRVPLLTPRLSGLWLGLVTPVYAKVGRELVDGLRHRTVVTDDLAARTFSLRPRGVREAIARALGNEDREFAQTRWSDALSSWGIKPRTAAVRWGTRLIDSRVATVDTSPAGAFAPIARIGGATGWYFGDWLWRLRGYLDLLVGGPGLRRGRRDPGSLAPGETVDFWRVEAVEPDRLLRLRAEMRLPGRAWLQFEVDPEVEGRTRIRQTAIFDPAGLLGLLYWHTLYPLHQLVFAGMLKAIVREAGKGNLKRPTNPLPFPSETLAR